MTRFRPCIDLHAGQVKQIVGGTLGSATSELRTNHVSAHPPAHFAALYRAAGLRGAHVVMLGPGNDGAAREALAAWPGGLQVGGGVTDADAAAWLAAGADKVIVTSFLFPAARFSRARLDAVLAALGGAADRLVIDLSCRRRGDAWFVATDKWQTITDMEVNQLGPLHGARPDVGRMRWHEVAQGLAGLFTLTRSGHAAISIRPTRNPDCTTHRPILFPKRDPRGAATTRLHPIGDDRNKKSRKKGDD
ncbi:hypothetical protein RB594_007454 [Gaeumannomyces avenae]